MEHLEVSHLFAMLVVMLGAAKIGGALAQRIGQPAVLGELVGGVIVGQSGLHLINTSYETIHMLSELGVFILLLAIGLETDLRMLVRVGATSTAVALVGVVLPFGLGYAACRLLGLTDLVAIMAGATLTATSVGITARVLADLGRLRDVEGQIILGAAVLDDILGLVILTVVTGLARGDSVTVLNVATTAGIAFGFLGAVILLGTLLMPWITRATAAIDLPGTSDDPGPHHGVRTCLAGGQGGFGDDPGGFCRGVAAGVITATARHREGDHVAGTLFRASLLRRRGSLG